MADGLMWVFINLVLPVAAPVLGMWLEQASAKGIRDAARRQAALRTRRIVMLFKDGQLGWVGLLMCFAAVSDFIDGARKHGLPEATVIVLIGSLALVLANGHFAIRGAAESSEALETFSWKSFTSDYPTVLYTACITASTAMVFAWIHFWAL